MDGADWQRRLIVVAVALPILLLEMALIVGLLCQLALI